jgi:hypothetical protein
MQTSTERTHDFVAAWLAGVPVIEMKRPLPELPADELAEHERAIEAARLRLVQARRQHFMLIRGGA